MHWKEENSTSVHSKIEAVSPKDETMAIRTLRIIQFKKKVYTGRIAVIGKHHLNVCSVYMCL